jgi:hypothetical protein
MPDITMCEGYDEDRACPMRETCRRATARPSHWQSYFMRLPLADDNKTCEYHWPDAGPKGSR